MKAVIARRKQMSVIHWWKPSSAIQLRPSAGRYVRRIGMAAQWMAHAIEANIPAQSARDERTATIEGALPDGMKRIIYLLNMKTVL
jgi:hypothetical protein